MANFNEGVMYAVAQYLNMLKPLFLLPLIRQHLGAFKETQ